MNERAISRLRRHAGVLLGCCLLAGCASPAYRIEKNPDAFARATPDQQERIRRGEIDIGFTPELVRLAWGPPTRTVERVSEAGVRQVWSYRAPDPGGYEIVHGPSCIHHPFGVPYRTRLDVEIARVVFEDRRVIEYERTGSAAGIR